MIYVKMRGRGQCNDSCAFYGINELFEPNLRFKQSTIYLKP